MVLKVRKSQEWSGKNLSSTKIFALLFSLCLGCWRSQVKIVKSRVSVVF